MHEVHVFGDSHWRVFFPATNHGPPGLVHEQDGIRMVDMVANELSGATMYGLLNDGSRNGARRRILGDLDRLGGVENVGLVFGEVDCRFHNARYFRPDGTIIISEVISLLARYRRFIEEDLLATGRVRNRAFIYFGFSYPYGGDTFYDGLTTLGHDRAIRASALARTIFYMINDRKILTMDGGGRIVPIMVYDASSFVSDDTVHLVPERIFGQFILPDIREALKKDG